MKPERLVYTFVSYAASFGDRGVAVEGVRRIAELAHRHGIPVTWIVDGTSIGLLKSSICEWHERYGDSAILACPAYKDEAELRSRLADETALLKQAFPWLPGRVLATGFIENRLIAAMEELDFIGLWGYCWQQSWWDGISHRGVPWGFWYADKDGYKLPSGRRIVAAEWTARDLNLALHTDDAVYYSTDPNDVLRAGLCTGDDIDYWKKLFGDYLRNTESNDCVFFVQQQEAHEMEASQRFAFCTEADIEASERMLDLFFSHISAYPIARMSLPEAICMYRDRHSFTAPSYMLADDSDIRPALNAYTMLRGGIPQGPWPRTFLYYDAECQLAFIKGKSSPHLLRNYIGKTDMNEEFKEPVPEVFVRRFVRDARTIEIEYTIESDRVMPFGLAYWDDLAGYEIASCEEVSEAVVVQEQLAFMRFGLKGEPKTIKLVLKSKAQGE
ncbi:hypothetical protein [Cohnella rhizosphaerae]|uniref:Uncharacterized protein n=1 Tax=Cohnella rhizosphaerae TaxID=1457232 RepID=A0A9X4KRU2_9BACL|nr:hypothetical protein [Cohnella rhizosphaerae]MDG0809959.1 hypothetical protein [Cohnella rhizosphaerae]